MTDPMRENFRLMACVATYTRLDPQKRIEKLLSFNRRLQNTPNIATEFTEWNLQLDNKLLDVPGRLLNSEVLTFGNNATIIANKGDWSRDMQNKHCLVSQPLKDWVLIVTERDKGAVQVLSPPSFFFRYYIFLCIIYMFACIFIRRSKIFILIMFL